jgi:hypothetical protein
MSDDNSDSLVGKVVNGWLRHFIGIGAGCLATHGLITHAQSQEVVGAVMTLLPIVWSAYSKWSAQQKLHDAEIALLQEQLKKGTST